jgi:hypothetical protein
MGNTIIMTNWLPFDWLSWESKFALLQRFQLLRNSAAGVMKTFLIRVYILQLLEILNPVIILYYLVSCLNKSCVPQSLSWTLTWVVEPNSTKTAKVQYTLHQIWLMPDNHILINDRSCHWGFFRISQFILLCTVPHYRFNSQTRFFDKSIQFWIYNFWLSIWCKCRITQIFKIFQQEHGTGP